MTDRRSFLAKLTGALAGAIASKHVVVDAAPVKKPVVMRGTDFKMEVDGKPVGPLNRAGPITYRKKPTRAIRVDHRGGPSPSKRNVIWDEFDVYVDGVRAAEYIKFDITTDLTIPWYDVTVHTYVPIDGVEPDEVVYTSPWVEYVYRGYRA